ncbi:adenylate/guanylate cyclase domain-containing protein [Microvirga sesbaniae]|uniref:adenylate/guanylate cyclase domain-containing protein n=1 Tax=Microvirga sesbaniae TaxID=681392 RepID=UPI0021C6354E|nr:adenylate/guanylate cyclase domain-containing protein [Microvirga sp. HBU67692]
MAVPHRHEIGDFTMSRSSGTRTTAAIVFIDLTGFTGLSEEVGLDATHRMLTRFHSIIGSTTAAFGGRVAARLGDGAMMIFSGCRSPDESAARSVAACTDLVSRMTAWMSAGDEDRVPDGFRIGAHLGEVVMAELSHACDDEATPLGDVVNVAQRLLEVAKDRSAQIVLSEDLVRAAAPLVPGLVRNLRHREQVPIRGRRKGISICLAHALAFPHADPMALLAEAVNEPGEIMVSGIRSARNPHPLGRTRPSA